MTSTIRNAWFSVGASTEAGTPASLTIPINGTYMLVNTARLFGTGDNESWKSKILYTPVDSLFAGELSYNATTSTETNTYANGLATTTGSSSSVSGHSAVTRSDLCLVSGGKDDDTATAVHVGYFTAGDSLTQQYFVRGSGTSTLTFGGDENGHIGLWAVRIGA